VKIQAGPALAGPRTSLGKRATVSCGCFAVVGDEGEDGFERRSKIFLLREGVQGLPSIFLMEVATVVIDDAGCYAHAVRRCLCSGFEGL